MNHDHRAEIGQEAHHWMLWSAASIFACGSCLSIASVVLCYLALQDARRNALPEAALRLKWGKRVTVTGAFLGFVGGFVALALRTLR